MGLVKTLGSGESKIGIKRKIGKLTAKSQSPISKDDRSVAVSNSSSEEKI